MSRRTPAAPGRDDEYILSLCLSVSLSLCLIVSLSHCLSVSLSLCLSLSRTLSENIFTNPIIPYRYNEYINRNTQPFTVTSAHVPCLRLKALRLFVRSGIAPHPLIAGASKSLQVDQACALGRLENQAYALDMLETQASTDYMTDDIPQICEHCVIMLPSLLCSVCLLSGTCPCRHLA